MAKGGITFARPDEARRENPTSEEVGTEKKPDVLEVVVKNEPIETKLDTGSNREIQQLKKEEAVISKEYEKRMRANQKSIKELKDVLRRDVNLGNAVLEEEMLRMRLEEIKQKMAVIEKAEEESKSSTTREEAIKESGSAEKAGKSEIFLAESERLGKIASESISNAVQADGYESDESLGKNEPASIEIAEGKSSLASEPQEESMQSSEAEMPMETIIEEDKAPEIVPDKLPVQLEAEQLVEQKILRGEGSGPGSGKNIKERIANNPEYLAMIAKVIREIFATKEKWEAMKDVAVEEIEARPSGRKRIIKKLESFRQRYDSILGNEASPSEVESVKDWIARVVVVSEEKGMKKINGTEEIEQDQALEKAA